MSICFDFLLFQWSHKMSYYMNQGPSSLANLSQDELKELLQDDFKLDERVQESVRELFHSLLGDD